jgi:hypothetical protein
MTTPDPDRVAFDQEALARWAEECLRQLGEALRPSVEAWAEMAARYVEGERRAAELRERGDG